MKRIAFAAPLLVAALTAGLASIPMKAGAAGVYENAAAEPAFLLSPRRIALRADLDFSRRDQVEASLYRVGAAFPLRGAFMIGLEQPFVSVSDSAGIESGIGDLVVRASAVVHRGHGRSLALLGFLSSGTGSNTFYPYSSQTLDVSLSAAFADTMGAGTVYATAGRTWVNRGQPQRPEDVKNADSWRGSAGAVLDVGPRALVRGGALYLDYPGSVHRAILYAGTGYAAAPSISIGVDIQAEVGPASQRVSDWAASAGVTILF